MAVHVKVYAGIKEKLSDALTSESFLYGEIRKKLETLFQAFACGSNRIRTYDLPGMNRGKR